jgi:hypothetical protein
VDQRSLEYTLEERRAWATVRLPARQYWNRKLELDAPTAIGSFSSEFDPIDQERERRAGLNAFD